MARATFVKKARKDIPGTNIKKGESYYWWKFRYGGKHYSKTAPKASQLTQSDFLSQLYDLQDRLSDFSCDNKEEFESFRDDLVSDIESLRDEQEEKKSNMPDQLQESPVAEMLQERYDALDEWANELSSVECDYDEDDLREEIKGDEPRDEETDDDGNELESEDEYNERIDGLVSDRIREIVDEAVSELQNCNPSL